MMRTFDYCFIPYTNTGLIINTVEWLFASMGDPANVHEKPGLPPLFDGDGRWAVTESTIYFESATDAVLFKLRFG